MSSLILLSDPNNPTAVIKAFQSALDVVLNSREVKRAAGRYYTDCTQYVYSAQSQLTIGCASIVYFSNTRDGPRGKLWIRIYTPARHGDLNAVYVSKQIAERMAFLLKGTTLRKLLKYTPNGGCYEFDLTAPLQVFLDNPHGVITIR